MVQQHQLPEPWVGDLRSAQLLFVSSNPSIDPDEDFPTLNWSDAEISSFFEGRFDSDAIRNETHHRKLNGDYGRSHYWAEIRGRAAELYGRPVRPGRDFALTEVVHCKSERQYGVKEAMMTCVDLHLDSALRLAQARVVVCVASMASQAMLERFGLRLTTSVLGPVDLLGVQRLLFSMPGPGSNGVRRIPRVLSEEDLQKVRSALS